MTGLVPSVRPTWRTKKDSWALSLPVTPRASIFQRRAVGERVMAVPLEGWARLVISKSALTTSSMTISVAPVLARLAANSANRSSRSPASGVTETWVAAGGVAHSLRVSTFRPSAPTRPMQ